MSVLLDGKEGMEYMAMGNEAIARGALEAGVKVASGYPGTPSSEIIERLADVAKEADIYVEWSVNEKVAAEVAAAASFAELRSLASMKQVGVNVASDFLLHLAISGTRGGMVLVTCEDPAAHSSTNEGDSRGYAKMMEFPLLEPGDFQEAKDMTKWAFELSEEIRNLVMLRSVTRMSHASGNVTFGRLPKVEAQAHYHFSGSMLDPDKGPVMSYGFKHAQQQQKLKKAAEIFEDSPFNTYQGPEKPELLIITCSVGNLYCKEAINLLGLEDRVGLLKLGTTWPLPPRLLKKHLSMTGEILIVEEILPFMEENVKVLAAEMAQEIGIKKFYGKHSGQIPSIGELSPDIVIQALVDLLDVGYETVPKEYAEKAGAAAFARAPNRQLTFCPGCPHRASFWSIHNALELDGRQGFVCGDIGCYGMAVLPTGFSTTKTGHAMGSGAGVASGFAKLRQFGMDQPVMAVCGDSTFFHAIVPALVNAVHHKSSFTLVVLDNSGTAMTGFQSHPGLTVNAMKDESPALDIAEICRSMGAKVEVRDPFDLKETQEALNDLMEYQEGAKVLVLKQPCALSPEKKAEKKYNMRVDQEICLGEDCGCNKLCTRIFRCPGLIWDMEKKAARIDEVICAGCGVCADICPSGAIVREEA
ncbi:MAG: indolepyruvate ferredoxin oxidoreductase [Deltaproteobacteria bacterium]|nr:indolepyruvate ferredoxin oxidoreductase [Deltaproteobacteria bacterium]MBW2053832.1 indolepyruvate ferredoxin oxidoreductase [Deltaproteobacteria bacterium]MBW2142198.1 indolepyruvate ferredoxin oxidoreductase [Deltaproteobacteria bacterium]